MRLFNVIGMNFQQFIKIDSVVLQSHVREDGRKRQPIKFYKSSVKQKLENKYFNIFLFLPDFAKGGSFQFDSTFLKFYCTCLPYLTLLATSVMDCGPI